MILRPLIESGWLNGVIAMMERRAPVFLAAGDLGDACEAMSNRRSESREEVVRRFTAQQRAGKVNLREISEKVGVSLRTVQYQTFALRRGKALKAVRRKRRASE